MKVQELKNAIINMGSPLPKKGSGKNNSVLKSDLEHFLDELKAKKAPQRAKKASPIIKMSSSSPDESNRWTNSGWNQTVDYCGFLIIDLLTGRITQKKYDSVRGRYLCADLPEGMVENIRHIVKLTKAQKGWRVEYNSGMPGIQFRGRSKSPFVIPKTNYFGKGGKDNLVSRYGDPGNIMYRAAFDEGGWDDHRSMSFNKRVIPGGKVIANVGPENNGKASVYVRVITKEGEYSFTYFQLPFEEAKKQAHTLNNMQNQPIKLDKPTARYRLHTLSKERKERITQDAMNVLAMEYKIHIQPKPKYYYQVIERVSKLLSGTVYPYIQAWKVNLLYDNVYTDEALPVVVIYPHKGKECAQKVLDSVLQEFKGDEKMGLDITPRYNHKVNSLIYWAGGHGDDKKRLKDSGKIGKYFNRDDNYSHFKSTDNRHVLRS